MYMYIYFLVDRGLLVHPENLVHQELPDPRDRKEIGDHQVPKALLDLK